MFSKKEKNLTLRHNKKNLDFIILNENIFLDYHNQNNQQT